MRCILHIDMDAFFAAVEQRRHPELRDAPVVAGGRGRPSERAVVATASYAARRFGIRSGMPLRTAFRRCPQCRFLPADYPTYLKVSEQIKSILRSYSSAVEEAGVDEAYLDLSSADDPVATARRLKAHIWRETGLSASVGIGPNKLLAKLASDLEKPDGLTVLNAADFERRIWPLPVERLLGVGPKTAGRLAASGVTTIGDLARLPEATLIALFKSARGHYLHRAANGIDETPIVTDWKPKSMSQQATFPHDTGDRQVLEAALRELSEGLVRRLRNTRSSAGSVSVRLRYADFESHAHTRPLGAPTDDFAVLFDAGRSCLKRFEPLTKKVRLVGVRFGALHPAEASAITPRRSGSRCDPPP